MVERLPENFGQDPEIAKLSDVRNEFIKAGLYFMKGKDVDFVKYLTTNEPDFLDKYKESTSRSTWSKETMDLEETLKSRYKEWEGLKWQERMDKIDVGISAEAISFVEKNQEHIRGAFEEAISSGTDDKFFKDPILQDFFRAYAKTDFEGQTYMQDFVNGLTQDADAKLNLFWKDREDGLTMNYEPHLERQALYEKLKSEATPELVEFVESNQVDLKKKLNDGAQELFNARNKLGKEGEEPTKYFHEHTKMFDDPQVERLYKAYTGSNKADALFAHNFVVQAVQGGDTAAFLFSLRADYL